MPSKTYQIWLDDHSWIAVDITMAERRVVYFCVRLMVEKDMGMFNLARYDSAHGVAHRDILNRQGNGIEKRWFPDFPFEEVLNLALDDFKLNDSQYEKAWEKR